MEKTKIEWCDSTWNPVTGCLHNCRYCYARRIANRFRGCDASPEGKTEEKTIYLTERQKATKRSGKVINAAYPYGFTPTFHEYRLDDPVKKGFGETIFVCSTADLFGEWVPVEWIEKVFDACKKAPNHRYLFLTKNPDRYVRLAEEDKLPKEDNYWYGTTITDPDEPAFFSNDHHTFISVEPILAPFSKIVDTGNSIATRTEWAIFGAETGNRKDKVSPRREWIEDAVTILRGNGTPVFMKDSLIPIWGEDIFTETPWNRPL